MVLIGIFAFFIGRGFWIARHAATRFESLLAVGLTSMVALAALINLGAVTGLLPVTGIPLPFISYGGTSIIVDLGAVGMLLGISRSTLDEEPEEDRLGEIVNLDSAREVYHGELAGKSRREIAATVHNRVSPKGKQKSAASSSVVTWRDRPHQSSSQKSRRRFFKRGK